MLDVFGNFWLTTMFILEIKEESCLAIMTPIYKVKKKTHTQKKQNKTKPAQVDSFPSFFPSPSLPFATLMSPNNKHNLKH